MDDHWKSGCDSHFPRDKAAVFCYTKIVLHWLQGATGLVYGDIPVRGKDY
jgi:hypothetical protein